MSAEDAVTALWRAGWRLVDGDLWNSLYVCTWRSDSRSGVVRGSGVTPDEAVRSAFRFAQLRGWASAQ